LSTTDRLPGAGGPYVTHEMCETVHAEQRRANSRTWEELGSLRRLLIALVVGGQLFTGGLNLVGFGYWLQQHAAQPHPATVQLLAAARGEAREDVRDLRREMNELAASLRMKSETQTQAKKGAEP